MVFHKHDGQNPLSYKSTKSNKSQHTFLDSDENGYQYDLCFKYGENDDCKHEDFDILDVMNQNKASST